jgi:GntR family transcriptional regulator
VSARVVVDVTSATPPFEQVRAQLAGHVAAGALRAGDRLPTVRALAADLGLAVGTVARAYRELEAQGVVVSRRRTGTVVAPPAPGASQVPDRGLGEAVATLVARARSAGLEDERVVDLVRAALASPS